jgi:hypothetical protein
MYGIKEPTFISGATLTRHSMYVCMYQGWVKKPDPCTATFNDLLCFYSVLGTFGIHP